MALHALASSPQLGSSARLGGSGALKPHWDPHNDPAPASGRTRTPSMPQNAARSRQRTITGGTLANGHAASPLACGLGLACNAPVAMTVVHPTRLDHVRSASSTPQMRRASLVDSAEQREKDRFAAVLTDLAVARRFKSPALHTPPRAAALGGAATRADGTFADPSSITPRRARGSIAGLADSALQTRTRVPTTEGLVSPALSRRTEDDTEAAQVLYSLASSPSPQLAGHSRFPGATPSLSGGGSRGSNFAMRRSSAARLLFQDEASKSTGSGLAMHGLGLAPPADLDEKAESSQRRDALFPPSLEGEAAKLRLAGGRSPPITPPRSDLMPSRPRLGSPAASGDAPSLDRSHSSDSSASSAPSSPSLAVRRTREPTTPPRQIASSPPTTPRAPGPKTAPASESERAWWRGFLNVSPSPRPNTGRFSPSNMHTPALNELDGSDDEDDVHSKLQPGAAPEQLRTPTRRSRARFPGRLPSDDLRELTASPMTPHSSRMREPSYDDDARMHKRRRTASRSEAL